MEKTTERIGYLLKRAQQALRGAMDAALREEGVTTPQYAALTALREEAGLSGADLARRCFVTPQTMSGIISNLEEAGLIERRPHPEHGRILEARLTPVGREAVERCRRAVDAIEDGMLADLDVDARRRLAAALRSCVDALE